MAFNVNTSQQIQQNIQNTGGARPECTFTIRKRIQNARAKPNELDQTLFFATGIQFNFDFSDSDVNVHVSRII